MYHIQISFVGESIESVALFQKNIRRPLMQGSMGNDSKRKDRIYIDGSIMANAGLD